MLGGGLCPPVDTISSLGVLTETAPTGRSLGFYVHVPFCTRRCEYCSFNTAPMDERGMARYLGAVRRELALLATAPWARRVGVDTIFFGGGTPSLLPVDVLAGLLAGITTGFAVNPEAEITVECNPESVTPDKLRGYRAAGVNRVSLGVQSLDDGILRRLGRLHTAGEARRAFDGAREAGCANVSVDLMYGVPALGIAEWTRTVRSVLDWEPDHLSAYGLTIDAGSRWSATGVDGLPPEDDVVGHYRALAEAAAARGFEHYEISNYARAGFRSRHNQIYWRAGEYLAAGPGACGFIGDVRYQNAKPLARYAGDLEGGALPIATAERLTPRQRLGERLILGLRLSDGVPSAWLAERAAGDARVAGPLAAWRERGLLVDAEERTRLTDEGFLLSDALFVELL